MLEHVTVTRYVTPLREGGEARAELAPRITEGLLKEVTDPVPEEWFTRSGAAGTILAGPAP